MKIESTRDLGTRECPSCACDIPKNTNRCPICSYEFPTATPRQKAMKLWGALIMLGLFLFVYLLNYLL